ncbi:MAG TPA: T9SS type A sorting domain-containing protein [Chitinophagaceae bacterium]
MKISRRVVAGIVLSRLIGVTFKIVIMNPKLILCFWVLLITNVIKGQSFYDLRNISPQGWEPYYYNYIGPIPGWEMINSNSLVVDSRSRPYLDIEWKTSNISGVTIQILNARGKILKTLMADNASTQRIYLDGLPTGRYMAMLTKGSDQQVAKFVIQ